MTRFAHRKLRFWPFLLFALLCLPPQQPAIAKGNVSRVPNYDHIVVVIMENKDYAAIIGKVADAPYINELASKGALATNYMALTHPSLPNYYALYAGTTFDILDDEDYVLYGPTLATLLKKANKTFIGFVEHPNSTDSHNPWTSFPEGDDVERDFKTFPTNFSELPNVSFVIPNVDNDMHDGTVAQGDAWLKANLGAYAEWAKANNSLLIVTWDETDEGAPNHVAAIFYGAHVKQGRYSHSANHYNMLSTILAAHNLFGPRNAADAPIIDVFGLRGPALNRPKEPIVRGPKTPRHARPSS